MKLTPQHRLFFAAILAAAVVAATVHLSLYAPVFDLVMTPHAQGGLIITRVAPGSLNARQVSQGGRLTRLGGIEMDGTLLIEEPDQLGTWESYNRFLDALGQLNAAVDQGTVSAEIDGEPVTLSARPRTIGDLPSMFWVQLAVGVLGFLIAAGVYAFRPRDRGAAHFAVTGLGLLLSATAATVYSTRELVMDGETVRLLSAVNWFGTLTFTAALVALLWEYPRTLGHRFPVPTIVYGAALLSWIGFVRQLFPDPGSVYLTILCLFSITFLFAWLQWRKTAAHPVERAALKWYLLSIYLGTGLFAAVILLPLALGTEPVASQGVMFVVFLLMFVGIALGITRYRLFDLDRWWLTAWIWFFGGLVVIGVDALLLWALGLTQGTSLALSLALVGWIYFPARQWLFSHLHRGGDERGRQIHRLIQELFSAEEVGQLAELWHKYLAREWDVLDLQIEPGSLSAPRIGNDAQTLAVPHLFGEQHLVLHHPHRGSRLFTRRDSEAATLLHQLARQALDGLSARHEAIEERRRIFGDLHDDVGSKLLSLLYRAKDPASGELARSALADLRDVVSQSDEGVLPLTDALADWRAEAQERLDDAGILLQWEQTVATDLPVSTFRLRHTACILREALNNVIKHAGGTTVTVRITETAGRLHLAIMDDGVGSDPETWREGRGMLNIRHRLNKLGGSVQWRRHAQAGCTLEVTVPLDQPLTPAGTPSR
ncbi:ATP-binding protein [Sedimenticola sp.]|uniref:ATP-binding protein n=1 Tax=Sedimenticola sp. TaxID=1940285 RepID=UPI003D13E2D5